jgi:hypothetical protein
LTEHRILASGTEKDRTEKAQRAKSHQLPRILQARRSGLQRISRLGMKVVGVRGRTRRTQNRPTDSLDDERTTLSGRIEPDELGNYSVGSRAKSQSRKTTCHGVAEALREIFRGETITENEKRRNLLNCPHESVWPSSMMRESGIGCFFYTQSINAGMNINADDSPVCKPAALHGRTLDQGATVPKSRFCTSACSSWRSKVQPSSHVPGTCSVTCSTQIMSQRGVSWPAPFNSKIKSEPGKNGRDISKFTPPVDKSPATADRHSVTSVPTWRHWAFR